VSIPSPTVYISNKHAGKIFILSKIGKYLLYQRQFMSIPVVCLKDDYERGDF